MSLCSYYLKNMSFCPYYLRTVLSVATLCESAKASLLVLCLYHEIQISYNIFGF